MTRRLQIIIYVDDPKDERAIPNTRDGEEYCEEIKQKLIRPFVDYAFLGRDKTPMSTMSGSSVGYQVNLLYPMTREEFLMEECECQ